MKNVIITGANSGLGFETAQKIALNKDYRIILACRNAEKSKTAQEAIIKATVNDNVETLDLDTSLLSSVRNFVTDYIEKYKTVDVLINNAGISGARVKGLTDEGFEIVFATNYLGHFLLTTSLLSKFNPDGRIINVSSDMHNPPGGIDWRGTDYLAHKSVNDPQRYSYSKLSMIYFTHELYDFIKKHGLQITVNTFNPGYMWDTNFSGLSGTAGKARASFVKMTMPDRYGDLETSSQALAELATDKRFDNVNDEYFDRSTTPAKSSELSYNRQYSKELWDKSLEYCGENEDGLLS